ncbi:2-dehydro-3-deoxygluconokinase [Microbacterium sp. SLBN-154]|uniref:sugar kinase n=1 Tax=Microbacterium sp. SLBN-154 TaxID=2768458 RepID=UPI001151FAE3|nr:sugar kinase [Microbacterium sp. SLBN-154]TQK17581.1 2-dehydro-3-deoxygluconokinase [Microbacterium sp. SLBN-154]
MNIARGDGFEVLCVGEGLAVALPLGDLASDAEPPRLAVHTGGAEGNVALHLAAQGISVAWASRVGADPFGRKVRADLDRGGVDVSSVLVDPEHVTGMYVKDTLPDGGSVMHYYRANSAASHLSPADVARFPLDRVDWVHVSGITAAISDSAAEMVGALIAGCRNHGVSVSFDVNFRARLWPVAQAAEPLAGIAREADLVFVGLDEAQELWGTPTATDVFDLLDSVPLVVVKDGAVGASELSRRGPAPTTTFVATPAASPVELIGAGDAFAGGYLAGLIRGEAPRDRLLRGHASAAWTIGSRDDVRPGHSPAPFAPATDSPERTAT